MIRDRVSESQPVLFPLRWKELSRVKRDPELRDFSFQLSKADLKFPIL